MRKLLLSILSLFAFALVANAAEITIDPDGTGVTWTAATDGTYGAGFTTTVNGLNVAIYKSTSTTDLVTPTDLIKVYKNAVLVIETQDGSNITNLAMTCSGTKYCKNMTGVGCNNATASGTSVLWSGSNSKVVLQATEAQVRMVKVVVTVVSDGSLAAPTFSVAGGTYYQAKTVEIANANGSGKVYYTTNGDDPTAESTEYTAPIEIAATTTLKAIVVDGEKKSDITSATYTIEAPVEVANIAEYLTKKDNAAVKFTNPVTAVYQSGSYLYVKDDSGVALIYGSVGQTYANGAVIPAGFSGVKKYYNGIIELDVNAFGSDSFEVSTENNGAITAVEKKLADITANDVHQYVAFKVVEILDINGKNFNITDGTTTVAAYNKFGLETIEAYKGIKIVGIVDVHNGEVQILPIEIDYKEGVADEAEISDDDDIVVSTGEGSIIVEGGDVIQIVTPDGRATTVKGSGDTPDRRRRIIETENGIYIVVVDGEVVEKVYVE